MPRHFWRSVVAVLAALAAYAGLVKHDGTFCHDVVRTGFGTDTRAGQIRFTAALLAFWVHIVRLAHRSSTPTLERRTTMKKLLVALATALLALAVTAAPAHAKDTSWGCGGACKHAGR